MAAVALDTNRIVQRLRAAGFDERQAGTFTDVFVETRSVELADLATKADLKAVDDGLRAEIARLEHRIELLEQSMNARFESLEQRMTIKLGLMLVAAVAAMTTLAKLL